MDIMKIEGDSGDLILNAYFMELIVWEKNLFPVYQTLRTR